MTNDVAEPYVPGASSAVAERRSCFHRVPPAPPRGGSRRPLPSVESTDGPSLSRAPPLQTQRDEHHQGPRPGLCEAPERKREDAANGQPISGVGRPLFSPARRRAGAGPAARAATGFPSCPARFRGPAFVVAAVGAIAAPGRGIRGGPSLPCRLRVVIVVRDRRRSTTTAAVAVLSAPHRGRGPWGTSRYRRISGRGIRGGATPPRSSGQSRW